MSSEARVVVGCLGMTTTAVCVIGYLSVGLTHGAPDSVVNTLGVASVLVPALALAIVTGLSMLDSK